MTEPTNDGAQAPRYTHRGAGPTGHKIDRDGERFCSIIFGTGQDGDALAREIVAALNGVAALREAAEAALSVLWNPDEYDRSLAQPLRDALIDALRAALGGPPAPEPSPSAALRDLTDALAIIRDLRQGFPWSELHKTGAELSTFYTQAVALVEPDAEARREDWACDLLREG